MMLSTPEHVSGAEREPMVSMNEKNLGGDVRGFFNSLEWNWSGATHIMSRPT